MIKVRDIAYVRFAAPDLGRMQKFLGDFGLLAHTGADGVLYARGTDPSPYVHVTEPGEPGFCGSACRAGSAAEPRASARRDGASAVEKIDAPGGGERVRFTDPDGFAVEVVHGREAVAPRPVTSAAPLNRGSDRVRLGTLQRIARRPSQVKRIGHAVIRCSDGASSREWYASRFGFVASYEVYLGERDNVVTAFLRCDRGAEYTDHHTFLCIGLGPVGFDHAAFEVEDWDDLMVGHDHLAQAGWEHLTGVGRHVLGSQVFDYWKDPWGHVVEHFTDGDLLNDRHETGRFDPSVALGTQWGRFAP